MNVFYVYLINKNNRNQNTNAFQFFDVWRMRSFRNVLHTSFGDNDKEDMERTISTIFLYILPFINTEWFPEKFDISKIFVNTCLSAVL